MVIMWKPVQLQGWGPGAVTINAVNTPMEKLLLWRQKVEQLVVDLLVDLLPGQEQAFGGVEPGTLFARGGRRRHRAGQGHGTAAVQVSP